MKAQSNDMNVSSRFDQKFTFLLEINFNDSEIGIATFFFFTPKTYYNTTVLSQHQMTALLPNEQVFLFPHYHHYYYETFKVTLLKQTKTNKTIPQPFCNTKIYSLLFMVL